MSITPLGAGLRKVEALVAALEPGHRVVAEVLLEYQHEIELVQPHAFGILFEPAGAFSTLQQLRIRPDFVLIGPFGAAAIEVDGTSHNGRYASDRSRDRLILNSGVQTHRIPIEETRDRSDLVEVLRHPIWQVCKIDVRRLDLWWDNAPGRGAA